MTELNIRTVENGFIASESGHPGTINTEWVFESADALARFIAWWGYKQEEGRPVVEWDTSIKLNTSYLGE